MATYGGLVARGEVREQSISAVVTRADGTIENRGVISYYSKNPIKHWAVNAWIKAKEIYHGRSRPK